MDKLLNSIKSINLGIFNNIDKCYVIGDLHGDVDKFLLFLKSINIIESINIPEKYNSYNISTDELKKDIDKFIIFNDLTIKNTCIVQLGDITDGHNSCKNNKIEKKFINNDIMIYAIIEKIINIFNNLVNCHFILIAGNHDIENIFNIYGINHKVKHADCDLPNYSHWAQYVLNDDELNADNKKEIVYNKLVKRKNYLQNDFDFFNNMYFIVSINDKTFFSHTLFYKSLLNKLLDNENIVNKLIEDKHININKDKLIINKSLIKLINNLLKLTLMILKEKSNSNKINKNIFNQLINDVIEKLFLLCSKRSKHNNELKNKDDIVDFNGHYFVGHEIQKEINKIQYKSIKHNMFNLYIYYVDVGLSKSLYDKNTLTNHYYIVIDYKKGISIKKCSDKECIVY